MASTVEGGDDYRGRMVSGDVPPTLQGGGGGGRFGDMEARVSNLEKRFDRMETKLDGMSEKLGDLRVDMGIIKERVSHLPTKGWAFTIAAGIIGVTGTIVTLAPKLQQIFGIIPK